MLKSRFHFDRLVLLAVLSVPWTVFPQGSWNPAGADLTFPRTLLDTTQIETIRSTLADSGIYGLYELVWSNAGSAPPAGNSSDGDRFTRSVIAKEAAFVALMNRKPDGGSVIPLTTDEREQFRAKSRQLLETINTNVGFQSGWIFYQEWQHRSKELINYLVAYDLLRGGGASVPGLQSSKDSLIAFTAHLYHRATATYTIFIWQFKFFEFQFNNHSIMTASALGLAAVVLNDHQSSDPDYQPLNWISAGLWNLDNTLWRENGPLKRVSEPDSLAGYAEGPAYFEYGFENAFPFIRSCWNFLPDTSYALTFSNITREIRNPWWDPGYARLYEWMNLIRMPDGSSPAIHDSPIGFGTSITALSGDSRFNIPNPAYPPDDPMWRTQYIATNVPQGTYSDTVFRALPEAGSIVFSSSHGPGAIWMHFIGKHGIPLSGAKAHHQGDAGSFSLMANGELLAVDPGYPGYEESFAVNKPTNHSLILVNGSGPLPPVGEYVSIETNTCWIRRCFDTPMLDFGEVAASYFGAGISRNTLFIRNRYFVQADFPGSENNNSYTYQLQGNGLFGGTPGTPEGAFIPDFANHRGIYLRDSTRLLVHTVATGGADAYTHETDSLATGTGQYRHYSKMLVHKNSIQNTGFLTVLFPYTDTSPAVTAISINETVNSAKVAYEEFSDVSFTQHDSALITIPASVSGLPSVLKGNGRINLIGYDSGNPRLFFFSQGDSLLVDDQPYIKAGHKLDVTYDIVSAEFSRGYVSDSGWVGFYATFPELFQPTFGNILEFYPDEARSLLMVRFASASCYTLELTEGVPEPGSESSLQMESYMDGTEVLRVIISCDRSFEGELTIFSVTGQRLVSMHIAGNPGRHEYPVDFSSLPDGLYLISATTTAGNRTVKTIK